MKDKEYVKQYYISIVYVWLSYNKLFMLYIVFNMVNT